jgi:hypothetical protein
MLLHNYLSEKQYDLTDPYSGKTIGHFRVVSNMPSDMFNENRHKMFYLGDIIKGWGYLEEVYTRDKMVELYGPITNEEFGPRGGLRPTT